MELETLENRPHLAHKKVIRFLNPACFVLLVIIEIWLYSDNISILDLYPCKLIPKHYSFNILWLLVLS